MNNPNAASSVDGSQSRRLACDRCRAQKLKCTRSELSDTCQRCKKAYTPCSFGRPLPPGRPRTLTTSANAPATDKRVPTIEAFAQRESENSRVSVDAQLGRDDEGDVQRSILCATGAQRVVDSGFSEGAWSPISSLDSESLNNMLYDDAFTAELDSSNFISWSAADLSSWPSMEQPRDTSGDPMQLTRSGTSVMSAESTVPPHAQKADRMTNTTIERRQANGPTSNPNRTTPPSAMTNSGRLGDSTSALNPATVVQKVTELGNVMCELQSTYSLGEHGSQVLPTSSDTFPTELSGKVLQVAIEFLRFLRCFFLEDSSTSQFPLSSSNSSSISQHDSSISGSSGRTQDRHSRGAIDQHQTRADTTTRYLAAYSSSSSSSTEWSFRRVYAADKPAALQLIASYLRLLQLYLLLYNAIYDYVRCTESASRHNHPIWKDLTIGGAPLHQFADFQIKLVLQVAGRLLEEIEGALGLSEACRVSRKSPAEGDGILGMNITAHFVEMCMAEATTGPEQGRGAIARLRDIMLCLTNLLDAPVLL